MIPPNDTNLEQSVLFGTIYNSDIAEVVLDKARLDWFYKPENKEIFEACIKSQQDTGAVDPSTVVAVLEKHKKAGAIANVLGGMKYASSLSNIDTHLEIIHDYAIRRKIILECTRITQKAYETDSDGFECVDDLAQAVTFIQDSDKTIHSMPIDHIIEKWETGEHAEPFFTGDPILDRYIYAEAGRHAGHVEVTVGHSGHGKTRHALYKTILLARNDVKTHWFQLEDYGYKTAKFFKAVLGDKSENIIITDSIFEIERIKREARISKREHGTQNIVIDYVQNLSADRKSRAEDVEYISRQLARTAIDLSCQVHLMSQVTIHDSQRKKWNLEPRAADVRWSRQLQQDAHIMTGVFRPSRVDGLYDDDWANDWAGNQVPLNSLYIRQLKTRYGEPYTKRYHMIDTDMGFVEYETWRRANEDRNNAHRVIEPITEQGTPF